jgi:uncharacterized protein (TIGR03083 family)
VPTTSDPTSAITALRHSHERLSALLHGLDADGIRQESYDEGWPIAQVASHLGSQAEVFGLMLDAGLTGGDVPGMPVFQQIWARWDSSTPEEQVAASIEANESFLARLDGLSDEERAGFTANLFGMDADLNRLVVMKLSEHAVHTWDVATALDPAATVSADAVDLLLDGVPALAARGATPTAERTTFGVTITEPDHRYLIVTGPAVSVSEAEDGDDVDATLTLPAEAFLRLVYGRLDAAHVPADVAESPELATLRTVFRGL